MTKQRPGQRYTLLEKIRSGVTPDRRGIRFVFGTALVIVMVLAAVIIRSSLPVTLTDADRAMLKKYESIRIALSQDDLGSAQKEAVALASSYKERRQVTTASLALSKTDSLESARDAFSTMSVEAVKMARGHEEYYVVGCSMNQCPAPCVDCQMWRFSDWVQTDPAIANPFMGRASPNCGVIR